MKKGRKKAAALSIQATVKVVELTDASDIDAYFAAIKLAIKLAYEFKGKDQGNG